MSRTPVFATLLLVGSCLASTVQAAGPQGDCPPSRVQPLAQHRVAYMAVQTTPKYDVRRPEVVSGARITLFANFLGAEAGHVFFHINGTSTECPVIEWKGTSVTVELPRLGLAEPKNAEIQIVMPDGRIAKRFSVLFVSQPDIIIHDDTIPQPTPPAPGSQPAAFAIPVHGGVLLQAEPK